MIMFDMGNVPSRRNAFDARIASEPYTRRFEHGLQMRPGEAKRARLFCRIFYVIEARKLRSREDTLRRRSIVRFDALNIEPDRTACNGGNGNGCHVSPMRDADACRPIRKFGFSKFAKDQLIIVVDTQNMPQEQPRCESLETFI